MIANVKTVAGSILFGDADVIRESMRSAVRLNAYGIEFDELNRLAEPTGARIVIPLTSIDYIAYPKEDE